MGNSFARYTVAADGTIEPTALQHVGCARDARLAYNAFLAHYGAAGGGRPRYDAAVIARHGDRQDCKRPGVVWPDRCAECRYAQAAIDKANAPKAKADKAADPLDMEYLAGAAFRSVFRRSGPVGNGFIYKISHYKRNGAQPVATDNQYNEGEYRTLTDARAAGNTWATPVSIWYVNGIAIVCQPYLASPGGDVKAGELDKPVLGELDGVYGARKVRHLPDMHGGNYRATRTGRIRVTDLGPVVW